MTTRDQAKQQLALHLHELDHGWSCGHHGILEESKQLRYEAWAETVLTTLEEMNVTYYNMTEAQEEEDIW